MPDITDPVSAKTLPDPPPLAARGVTRPLIIDCRGPEGVLASAQAPINAILSGHADLTIYPGIQSVSASTWTAYVRDHNGISARVAPPKVDGKSPDPHIVVLDGLPRRAAAMTELVDRTWSTAGLDMLEAHETSTRDSPRTDVATALAAQRRRLARRIKPVTTH